MALTLKLMVKDAAGVELKEPIKIPNGSACSISGQAGGGADAAQQRLELRHKGNMKAAGKGAVDFPITAASSSEHAGDWTLKAVTSSEEVKISIQVEEAVVAPEVPKAELEANGEYDQTFAQWVGGSLRQLFPSGSSPCL